MRTVKTPRRPKSYKTLDAARIHLRKNSTSARVVKHGGRMQHHRSHARSHAGGYSRSERGS